MKKLSGRVVEVFIPDNMNQEVGFRVETDEGINEIIEEQDEYNSKILREDNVIVTEQIIDGKYFIDIELGEER